MQTMEVLSAILLLFYAGYVTGKEIERSRFEKKIKRGIFTMGNKLYFCTTPWIVATTHVRNATQEEREDRD